MERYAFTLQLLCKHRLTDVRALRIIPQVLKNHGQSAHTASADADEMNALAFILLKIDHVLLPLKNKMQAIFHSGKMARTHALYSKHPQDINKKVRYHWKIAEKRL